MRTSRLPSCARIALTLLWVPLLLSCKGMQSALDPRGPQAARVLDLTIVLFAGASVVFVLVIGFLAAGLFVKRTERDLRHDRGTVRMVIAAAVATTLSLVALLLYDFGVTRAMAESPEDAVRIEVIGHQWWWEVNYLDDQASGVRVRTANELHVPVGRPVSIALKSRDVIHSFWVPNLHGKVDMIPGRTNHIVLQADVASVYRGQCAEFCGLQHANMAFYVVAEPQARFDEWLEHQRRPAMPATDDAAKRGQQVFLTGSCALCHAIRGTTAMASAGPDLTHVGSRLSLAAAALPNTRGNLGGWILDPQHTKAGAWMPSSRFDGQRLNALLEYLASLE